MYQPPPGTSSRTVVAEAEEAQGLDGLAIAVADLVRLGAVLGGHGRFEFRLRVVIDRGLCRGERIAGNRGGGAEGDKRPAYECVA